MAYTCKSRQLLGITLSIFVVSFLRGVCSLKITRLSVPDFVKNGTEESVILDCEYEYQSEADNRLVVKWFHNDDPNPVYQWIPEHGTVRSSGKFGDRINTEYEVDEGDDFTRHRALNILRPTTELSGKYSCQVTSMAGFDAEEDFMMVYAPPSAVYMNYTVIDDMVNIMCIVEGVFPMPEVDMFQIGPGEVDPSPVDEVYLDQEIEENAFNIVLMTNISEETLETEGLRFFGCNVTLPGTEYSHVTKVPYFPDEKDDASLSFQLDDAASSFQPFVLTISILIFVHLFHWW